MAANTATDGNCLLTIDDRAIQRTHSPDVTQVDVRSLHELISEILKPSATVTTVEGVPCDQDVLGSLLESFNESFENCSRLPELVKIQHNIYSQLCSGGGDVNSTTEAVFRTLSHYSWETKMVVALAAFAIIYGEWWVMVEPTDPLAKSIKLLKQLPHKSKLTKIKSLIDAIVQMTHTIIEAAHVTGPLPDNISMKIQTAVSWTVGSIVVCTSHIMSVDYTDTNYLSTLTGKVVGMDTELVGLLAIFIFRFTINERMIRTTHASNSMKVDVSPLHKLIQEILKPTVEDGPQDQAVLDSRLKFFKKNSENLAKTVHKICNQLRCKCLGGEDAISTTVALFNMLSRYSWEAKLVLALAAFAIIYGEWSLMAGQTNPLAKSIKLLKQLPKKSKLSKIRSLLINAILKVSNTIVMAFKVEGSPLPENISNEIQTAVSWTAGCIVVCSIQIIGVVGLVDKYNKYDLSILTKKVNGLNTNLHQLLRTWRRSIENKKRQIDQALQKGYTEDTLRKMINPDPDENPLIENKEEVILVLRKLGLQSSNLILAIDFTKSNKRRGERSFNKLCLHAIGDTPNPYEQAIAIIGATLASFAKDNLIPCYGFGDATTTDQKVFSFHNDNIPCEGFEEVLTCYRQIAPRLILLGGKSFAPAIDAAIEIVEQSRGQHHVLVIIADGPVTTKKSDGTPVPHKQQTIESIVTASSYALSIVVVGVGDGPWGTMNNFADNILGRKFDNFQFVDFTDIMSKDGELSKNEAEFALVALKKIPKQYEASKEHGFLGRTIGRAEKVDVLPPPSRH